MIHPMIFEDAFYSDFLCISGENLIQLIKVPKSILWVRGTTSAKIEYFIIPVEIVKKMISFFLSKHPPNTCLHFKISDAVNIPVETGETMRKYNGNKK